MKLKCSTNSVVIRTSKGAINTQNTLITIEIVPSIQYNAVATLQSVQESFLRQLF